MRPYFENGALTLYCGDASAVLAALPDELVQVALSSPPYWALRDYGNDAQIGAELTPQAYVERLRTVYSELRRVLRRDGTCWVNLGDSYITNPGNGRGGERVGGGKPHRSAAAKAAPGLKTKDLVGIPWRTALALQEDGWWLRSDVIWQKPNVKPDGAKDRPTASHEYVFLLSRSQRYFYDSEAVAEAASDGGTRNRRTVWSIPTAPYADAHFACWPPKLAELMIRAGSRVGDTVLDPFFGAGTTALAARSLGRRTVGIEISREYCELALKRLGYR